MKNNTKKGFTLVELLVVIAILAILATVSVVGYTSFIESANVAVDEDLVAQLNNFLAAYKVNNTEDITEDNAWEVTQEILELSGLDKINGLVPKSKDNHFYFNVQEQEYQLVTDTLVTGNGSHFFNIFGFAASNLKPGVFTSDKNQTLFLVDTAGWDVADVVRGFYTLDNYESINAFLEEADAMEGKYSNLAYWANNTVFVTKDGNFVVDLTTKHSHLVVYNDATFIGNTKNNFANFSEPITESNPLLTVTEKTTIKIPAGVKLPANSLTINAADGLVTVVIDEASWSTAVKDNIDANFTNDNVVVSLGGRNYKINSNEIHVAETYGNDGVTYVDLLKYNNPLFSFDLLLNSDNTTKKVYNSTTNLGYVALDKKDFTLSINADSIVGVKQNNDNSDTTVVSTRDVEWSVHPDSASVLKYENGKFTFTSDTVDTVKVVATAKVDKNGYAPGVEGYDATNCASQTYEIKVVRLTGATLTLAEKPWNDKATLIHSGAKEYEVKISGTPSYVNKIAEIELNETLTLNYSLLTGAGLTTTNGLTGKITTSEIVVDAETKETSGNGTGTLTVKVGDYVTYTVDVTIFDVTHLPLTAKSNNLLYVGSGNVLKLSDLFAGEVPAGAELRVFSGIYGDDNYMDMDDRDLVPQIGDTGVTSDMFSVKNNIISLSEGSTMAETIEFNKNKVSEDVCFAVVLDGVRISPDIEVRVVDANNVRAYSDLVAGESNVLMSDIAMNSESGVYTVAAGKTLYGNCYTIDTTNASVNLGVYGYLTLSAANASNPVGGTLTDVKVLGKVFPKAAMSGNDEYGVNAVWAQAGSVINNCYISNTRTPLIVGQNGVSGIVTIRDTVLFGGAYANADLRGGTLRIEGNVTTVQQPVKTADNKTVMGIGITAWFEDTAKAIDIAGDADFRQYNFLNSSSVSDLPTVTYSGIPLIDLAEPFNALMAGDYATNQFTASNGKVYLNSGMAAIDKYMFKYTVACQGTDGACGSTSYTKGSPVTITITVPHAATNASYTIYYDNTKYYESDTDKDGELTVTGANLTKGQTITHTLYLATDSFSSYDFDIRSEQYKTLNITGLNNNGKHMYENAFFSFDLSEEMAAVDFVNKDLHGSGMHYKYMQIDVYTPNNEDDTNKSRLEEYLAMGSYYENGAGSTFTNGKIKPYGSN